MTLHDPEVFEHLPDEAREWMNQRLSHNDGFSNEDIKAISSKYSMNMSANTGDYDDTIASIFFLFVYIKTHPEIVRFHIEISPVGWAVKYTDCFSVER